MASKDNLYDWVHKALIDNGGSGGIVDVCKHIWKNHERELREAGDLFFTWQYDMRWAGDHLRKARVMKPANVSPKGLWELAKTTSKK